MIKEMPKTLVKAKIEQEATDFCKKYRLTDKEKKELNFIMDSFVKYYNKLSESDQSFSQKDVIESFDAVLETITETYNGTGTQTRANIFWKQIPSVADMERKENYKKTMLDESKDEEDDPPVTHTSHRSYTPVQSYTPSHSYSSYGGCGGGGGGYGGYSGGHC